MATQCFTCMHARPLPRAGRAADPFRSAAAAVTQRSAARRPRASRLTTRAGLDLDWSDPDTLIGLAGAVLGIAVGIGAPLFYISRDEADEKRLEELRELNRQTYKETGEYMTEVGPSPPHVLPALPAIPFPCSLLASTLLQARTAEQIAWCSLSSGVISPPRERLRRRRRLQHSADLGGPTAGAHLNWHMCYECLTHVSQLSDPHLVRVGLQSHALGFGRCREFVDDD